MTVFDKSKLQAVENYIDEVSKQFSTCKATEHSYRPALATLLSKLLPKYVVTNEPQRIDCGAPDYIISKSDGSNIPVAFVEAKDVNDRDLDGNREHKEQFNRYKNSLDHILFTDYLDFHLYEFGELRTVVRIAEVRGNKIALIQENVAKFLEMVDSLAGAQPQKITSAKKLAQMMASKAKLLAETISQTLENDTNKTGELAGQWNAFKKILIHDLTEKAFADIYAQTICYGMFAARLHDKTPDTFSRAEAATLIPETNPFLRKIFQNIACFDLDESIVWIVDDLVETFRVTDVPEVMKNFGQTNGQNDPLIHFYEDFLFHYDPKQKKSCGVYYTPEPVVDFMVDAVNQILKDTFDLPKGLADTRKVNGLHRVQILDPATGTATFPAKIVRKIYGEEQSNLGAWQNYVEEHLLPRLHGFELMMAPYAIAHLKLDMVLSETGYVPKKNKRLRIYLTNSLEECNPDTGTFFAQWLAQEATEADYVKRDTPLMVMIGNPPYNGESKNNGPLIMDLMRAYKLEPKTKNPLKERNSKWINDDYCKFIRLAQHYVDKNKSGIVAYINNHSFLDNPTFRGMRWSLLKSFDEIYVLDLHGNSKKKESAPDGSKDENVFDIMQGVSINIFVKKGNVTASGTKQSIAKVYHYELYGKRFEKYHFLQTHSIKDIPWQELNPQSPQYFFVPKSVEGKGEYEKGFAVNELFKINGMGITSAHDDFVYGDWMTLKNKFESFQKSLNFENLYEKFDVKPKKGWNILEGWQNVQGKNVESFIRKILYRPFDETFVFYEDKLVWRPVRKLFDHFYERQNIGLCLIRINSRDEGLTVFATDKITDKTLLSSKDNANVFPLYLYPTEDDKADCFVSNDTRNDDVGKRKPNFDETIWSKIDKCVGNETTPEQVFDYIYGVLHTPSYRERFKDFLKIDFPRIPYPKNADNFNRIASVGEKLSKLHLMQEIPSVEIPFKVPGDNAVTEIRFEDGKVFINKTQCFENVPELAWNFYIGGYQPAQKWLKDRKGRNLSYEDIEHYQKIIAILAETHNLMQELDEK